MPKGISRFLLPFTTLVFMASLLFAGHVFAYALIDLDPGSANRVQAASSTETEAEGTKLVEASFKQKGHLLALVPVSLKVKVRAYADGTLEFDYPWYAFMTISRREELKTKLKVGINNARQRSALGSVRAEGVAQNPEFTEKEATAVAGEIERILNEELGGGK